MKSVKGIQGEFGMRKLFLKIIQTIQGAGVAEA